MRQAPAVLSVSCPPPAAGRRQPRQKARDHVYIFGPTSHTFASRHKRILWVSTTFFQSHAERCSRQTPLADMHTWLAAKPTYRRRDGAIILCRDYEYRDSILRNRAEEDLTASA